MTNNGGEGALPDRLTHFTQIWHRCQTVWGQGLGSAEQSMISYVDALDSAACLTGNFRLQGGGCPEIASNLPC
jgi:hypothetical protein